MLQLGGIQVVCKGLKQNIFWDGTWIIDGLSLLDLSDLELESIDEVQTIEFGLRVINSDSWKELVTTDPITLNCR